MGRWTGCRRFEQMASSLWSYFLSCRTSVELFVFTKTCSWCTCIYVTLRISNILLMPICKGNKWWCLVSSSCHDKYRRRGGLNHSHLCVPHSSETGNSNSLGAVSLPVLIRAPVLSDLGSTLWLHLNLITSLKALSSNIATLRVRTLTYELRWGAHN